MFRLKNFLGQQFRERACPLKILPNIVSYPWEEDCSGPSVHRRHKLNTPPARSLLRSYNGDRPANGKIGADPEENELTVLAAGQPRQSHAREQGSMSGERRYTFCCHTTMYSARKHEKWDLTSLRGYEDFDPLRSQKKNKEKHCKVID